MVSEGSRQTEIISLYACIRRGEGVQELVVNVWRRHDFASVMSQTWLNPFYLSACFFKREHSLIPQRLFPFFSSRDHAFESVDIVCVCVCVCIRCSVYALYV